SRYVLLAMAIITPMTMSIIITIFMARNAIMKVENTLITTILKKVIMSVVTMVMIMAGTRFGISLYWCP
ncbi:MAG TPA: hypothetical protein PKA06_09010, partial [Gemmatales bacterium]|nr:hypothetical protein [Gemmatales bacterium]